MLPGLDGVLLGRQAEGVPAHRVQDVVAERAAVTGQNVRGGVAFRMPDVQPRAGRVGEHVEDVELGQLLRLGLAVALGEGMACGRHFARVPGAKSLLLVPLALPFGFDQVERILSASGCHKPETIAESARPDNGRIDPEEWTRRGRRARPLTISAREAAGRDWSAGPAVDSGYGIRISFGCRASRLRI